MKFIAQITPLQETLSKVIAVIPAKSTLPQLETVSAELKNNRLSFTGTDLEITVVAALDVTGVGKFNNRPARHAEADNEQVLVIVSDIGHSNCDYVIT